jgi:transposase
LLKLIETLDKEDIEWKKKKILVLDNAAIHRSKLVTNLLSNAQIPYMFLGPYSYRMAPIEELFGHIKKHDLNEMDYTITSK